MIHKEYICSILARFEGSAIRRGYVPCKGGNYTGVGDFSGKEPFGASGVTIGTGFDLGQQTAAELNALGLAEPLYKKLLPYTGRQRQNALAALADKPLELTGEEVAELDGAVQDRYINETAVLFGRPAFERAPRQAQAVAVSLHYQFGTPARAASPSLGLSWNYLRSELYREAAKALRDPGGWSESHRQYLVRRRQEAALLDEIGERGSA
jgi:hypothetical protein